MKYYYTLCKLPTKYWQTQMPFLYEKVKPIRRRKVEEKLWNRRNITGVLFGNSFLLDNTYDE